VLKILIACRGMLMPGVSWLSRCPITLLAAEHRRSNHPGESLWRSAPYQTAEPDSLRSRPYKAPGGEGGLSEND
jgi:hypothetical protein